MFFAGLGLAIIIAFILTLVLGKGVRRYGYADLLGFFFILFLATWAGGLWIDPVGPAVWGVALFGYIAVGVIIALALAAALPTPRHRVAHPAPTGTPADQVHQESFLNVFLWITILALLAAIAWRFYER